MPPKDKKPFRDPLCVGYDMTISCDKSTHDHNEIIDKLDEWFSKWVFQKEQGEETDYVHWQIRGHLYKPKRVNDAVRCLSPEYWNAHVSVTTSGVHHGNKFNYVMKADTRVEGPWSDLERPVVKVMTRQLEEFIKRGIEYQWHQDALDLLIVPDNRSILLIIDKKGGSCKSLFAEYLEYKDIAFELPPLRAMEDLMQFAFGFKDQPAYLIDMPRGMKKDKLGDFYAGIECLKNGVLWDKRYNAKKRRMSRPNIIVFSNAEPVWDLMSLDRWRCFIMQDDKTLIEKAITSSM